MDMQTKRVASNARAIIIEKDAEIAELTKVIELMDRFIKNAFNFTPPPIEYFTQRAKEIIRKDGE